MYPNAVSISSDIIVYLRHLYAIAINEAINRNDNSFNINGYTEHSIPSYIISVAGIEAFLNEMFLSPGCRCFLKSSSLDSAFWSSLENAKLLDKLIFLPQLFFDQTFDKGKSPYQEMKLLISTRNELVHFKMDITEPKFVKNLQRRGIALNEEGSSWQHNISTLEGIRWAHNVICETIRALGNFANNKTHPILANVCDQGFYSSLSDSFVKEYARRVIENNKSATM